MDTKMSMSMATNPKKPPIFPVQTGLRAGAQDRYFGNDAARAAGAAQGVRDFLASWFG
jgi:hypothetical protein